MQTFEIKGTSKIGEIVAEDYRAAEVFRRYGIDFCCGGKKTLQQVCESKNIAVEEVVQALADPLPETASGQALDFNHWDLDLLSDYIVKVHHRYVREKLPQIEEYSKKVALAHGPAYPETKEIALLVQSLMEEMTQHMRKEELILFPYIKALVETLLTGKPAVPPPFGTVKNPIRVMEAEHDAAGDIMKNIRMLSKDYALPSGACNTYRVLYALLEEFERDLHQHVHLENNILFPKAARLEEELITGQN
jgi:regulator of cell morphogenesis and NO signaling